MRQRSFCDFCIFLYFYDVMWFEPWFESYILAKDANAKFECKNFCDFYDFDSSLARTGDPNFGFQNSWSFKIQKSQNSLTTRKTFKTAYSHLQREFLVQKDVSCEIAKHKISKRAQIPNSHAINFSHAPLKIDKLLLY